MGPQVMYLSPSSRYVSHLTFKYATLFDYQVFILTVCFGLFHGLVLFPVLLSLVGPYDELPPSAVDYDQTVDHGHSTKHEGLDNPTFSDVCLEDPNTSMMI